MINLFQPNLGKDEIKKISEVFSSNWIGRGQKAMEFEGKLSNYLKTDNSNITTVSSCSDGLRIIIEHLKINLKLKGTIVVPVNSFPVVPAAVVKNGFNLLLCDIDFSTGCIDTKKLNANKNDIVAFMLTSYGGNNIDLQNIRDNYPNAKLILDAACSLGSFDEKGDFIGKHADFSVWSFDAMKLLNCGEGGAIYCRNSEDMELIKSLSYLGLPPSEKSGLINSNERETWWEYDLTMPAYRSIFTDLNASIGLAQLQKINQKLNRKRTLRKFYEDNIKINFLENNVSNHSNYFFTIYHKERNKIANELKQNGIYTSLRYWRVDKTTFYSNYSIDNLEGANKFYSECLNLPIHSELEDHEIEKIISIINELT